MWFLPTRGRPELCTRLIKACRHTNMTQMVVVCIDDEKDDSLYASVPWPDNWIIVHNHEHLEMAAIFNRLFKHFPNESFYGFLEDDVVPLTPEWDKTVSKAAGKDKIVYTHDGVSLATNRITAMGGDLVRALGWICLPGCVHMYVDNTLTDICNGLQNGVFLKNVIMDHKHFTVPGGDAMDETYERVFKGEPYIDKDRQVYEAWVRDERDDLLERVRATVCTL